MRNIRNLKHHVIRWSSSMFLAGVLIGYIVYSFYDEGFDLLNWDWLFLSSTYFRK